MIDEVANGLSYYDYTFFRELPRLYAAIEDKLVATRRASDEGKPIPLVPARRLLDRRRPRRQSVRDRRRAERGDAPAERAGAQPLSRRAARARRRVFARRQPDSGQRGAARARRPLERPSAATAATSPIGAPSPASIRVSPRPRASSTMSSRCASRLTDAPAYASAEELRRPRDHRALAQGDTARGILARGRLRALAARGRLVRLSSRADRPEAELGRARAHRRRAVSPPRRPASTTKA